MLSTINIIGLILTFAGVTLLAIGFIQGNTP